MKKYNAKEERKEGKWINNINYSGWTCTNCGYHDDCAVYNFCPNCGARMKGEPMKGLLNNGQAVRVSHSIKDSMIDPIHQIYNLGYEQGYKDAVEEVTRRYSNMFVNVQWERSRR